MSFESGEESPKIIENYDMNECNAIGDHVQLYELCLQLPCQAGLVDWSFEVISDEADPA